MNEDQFDIKVENEEGFDPGGCLFMIIIFLFGVFCGILIGYFCK